ncbi:MAG: nitroreductase family protein [Candidatus Bipolaricaulota bacterium]|nr:nitroreductase family protein [Candidatus Bipolaricaulota bacterium]
MKSNPVLGLLMRRASVREFTPDVPSDEVLETIVQAAQQAPFAAQMGSLVLRRDREKNPFHAPLLFTVCADVHRLELVLARRGWKRVTSDAAILVFALQDAAYMAENLVIAGEALGLGSCYLGNAAFAAEEIAREYDLPEHVFPFVQLAVGYPVAAPIPRPRYPVPFTLHEDRYREPSDDEVTAAMAAMDDGYIAQDYYRDYAIPLEGGRAETFTRQSYSWTEHMGRKWGQWLRDPEALLSALRACGFDVNGGPGTSGTRGDAAA